MIPIISGFPGPMAPAEPSTTKLLLHFDGSNNSTTITDSSEYARTMVRYESSGSSSTSVLKTANKKFGTASYYHDSVSFGYVYPSGTNSDLTIGTQDFTIDCWFLKVSSTGTTVRLWGYNPGSFTTGYLSLLMNSANKLQVYNGGSLLIEQSDTVSNGHLNWTHAALTRSGTSMKLFVNGVQKASATNSTNWLSTSNRPRIGNLGVDGGNAAYIDEFRLVVGEAKWTANFTPPTGAYT